MALAARIKTGNAGVEVTLVVQRLVFAGDKAARLHGQSRAQQRGVDPLPLAGSLAHEQRQHDAVGGEHGGKEIDDGAANEHRAPQGTPLCSGDAGHRLQHLVKAGFAGKRPLGPIAGNAAVDELWLTLPQVVIADLQPLSGARTEILDNDVGLAHQAVNHFAASGLLEIQPQSPLVAVDALEEPAAVGHG